MVIPLGVSFILEPCGGVMHSIGTKEKAYNNRNIEIIR